MISFQGMFIGLKQLEIAIKTQRPNNIANFRKITN